jgi:magnesium chelatase subunit D
MRAAAARTGTLNIGEDDLREKIRAKKVSSVVMFVVDASGSMAAIKGITLSKITVMSLLEESYQKRDRVGMIAVSGHRARVILSPTSSVQLAVRHLKEIPMEGLTPLSDGLYKGFRILKTEIAKRKNVIPILIIVSDGRANVPMEINIRKEIAATSREIKKHNIHVVVIDTTDNDSPQEGVSYNKDIAEKSGGSYFTIDELDSNSVVNLIRTASVSRESINHNLKTVQHN